jgi:starvation-inducible DNA-binding protein
MELTSSLSNLLSNVVVFYFRAHGYHWNVEGPDFSQYHGLFEDIYEDTYSSVDPIAENIRKLGEYAPFKLDSFIKSSTLTDSRVAPNPKAMAEDLLSANEDLVKELKAVFNVANDSDEQGIANFIAERIDMHQKWSWQLRSSIK